MEEPMIHWTCHQCCPIKNPEEFTVGALGPAKCIICGKDFPRHEIYALPNHPFSFIYGNNETLSVTPDAMKVLSKAAKGVDEKNAFRLWVEFFRAVEETC